MGYPEFLLHKLQSHGILAAFFYALCSTSMAFLNKAVISSYNFNFPFFIMACQMTVSIAFLEIMISTGKLHIPAITFKAAKGFLLPSLAYGFHSTLSLMALKGMNIPMYTAVKRCTPLVNLILAVLILRKPLPSIAIILSIQTITIGCIIAVYGGLRFDSYTYTVGVMSVFAQGFYLTLVQKASENHYSTLEILQLNSYNTLAPFIVLSVVMREPQELVKSPYMKDPTFLVLFWTLVSLGAVLNYSLFLCTSLNSALTTSLVGVAKSSFQTVAGFFVFGGVKYDPWTMTGITLNFFGGIVYVFVKYREKERSTTAQKTSGLLPSHLQQSSQLTEIIHHSNNVKHTRKG